MATGRPEKPRIDPSGGDVVTMRAPPAPCVLVGIDGSDHSLDALDLAADEAVLRDCSLRVLTVIHWPILATPTAPESSPQIDGALIRAARSDVDAAARRASRRHPGLRVTTDVVVGAAAGALIEESGRAELLVVGHRGTGGFVGLVTGSVVTQVARRARCPVIVAHRPSAPHDAPEGPVVVGIDGSPHSERAVEFAFDEASRRGVTLVAVQVWSQPLHPANGGSRRAEEESEAAQEAAARSVEGTLRPYRRRYPGLTVTTELPQSADVEDALVRRSKDAALVVVGSRGRGALAGALLGSVGQALVHHGEGPVAIVRAEDPDARESTEEEQ
jgi:nucleotide-binding universal stress UspA family protein